MRKCITVLCALLVVCVANAQSKIFKEISDDISSKMKVITQDNNLVGYLVFTQLEKTSEDSFSYKISIMDENLNDIGTVKFKEEKLDLQSVSFESDVLCLGYLKSNIEGQTFKNYKDYKKELSDAKHAIVTQFLGLDGKIIKTNQIEASVNTEASGAMGTKKVTGSADLKESIQLKNIPQKGFAMFYGDRNGNKLVNYSLSGDQLWKKSVDDAQGFVMLTSASDIYLLSKRKVNMLQGGYQVDGYNYADSITYPTYYLKDKQGNELRVLSFDNDPISGKPVITGNIIDDEKGNSLTAKGLGKGMYSGVFTVALNGPKKADRIETYSYWNDGSMSPSISNRGRFSDIKAYCNYTNSFRDFQGNTYFAGPSVIKRTKWGSIVSATLFSWTLMGPVFILGGGTSKFKAEDALLIKQNAKGALSVDDKIACNSSGFVKGYAPVSSLNTKSFYTVANNENKLNYMIIDDTKDIVIYNVTKKKVMRTVPHKDGKTSTNIYPAKEGYVMVQEYNRKDKYLKLSIEAL